jgi:carbon monoxide dehydrogenase subunit G
MASIVVSTHVSAPLEKVFEVYTELEKAEERIPGITKLELLSEGPFGNGTRWRETRVMMKKEATEEMWVTGFDPPRSYTVEAQSHGMLYQTLFTFEPEGDGTKVTWTFGSTPQTLGAKLTAPIFGLFFTGMMKKCMLEDLEALRDVCEGQGTAAATAPQA